MSVEKQASLPKLTPLMLRKLRLLTIVSLATLSKELPYVEILNELDLPREDVRGLEDLIIEGLYADLYHGSLDQRAKVLRLVSVVARDVDAPQFHQAVSMLGHWVTTTEQAISQIDQQIHHIRSYANQVKSEEEEFRNLVVDKELKRNKKTSVS
jgi:COP9 signalosome complex subunit 7